MAALTISDVRVPVDNLLGEIGKGHKVAFCTLNMGRLKLATNSASGARGASRTSRPCSGASSSGGR